MKNETCIFTEVFNCGRVGRIALESFHKYHDRVVFVFGSENDFEDLGDIKNHRNNRLIDCSGMGMANMYKSGHLGTATVFATVLNNKSIYGTRVIHFDSDLYFKKESLSIIENAFDEGFDVIGSRRCYGNNPADIPGLEKYPDTISTYFFGIKSSKIPAYNVEYCARMCQGAVHPLGYPILDFFDPVTHAVMHNGGRIKYLDFNLVGGQNEEGKKTNKFTTNLHMDVGEHIIHFGGVGSGCAYFNGHSSPEKSYAEWALGRWSLFAKVFYNEEIGYMEDTQIKSDGRWVNGNYNLNILQSLINDMK